MNKVVSSFPDPSSADENGLLCAGGELSPALLLEAYARGIFPWPEEGLPLLWFSPPKRGLLFFDQFHVPKRFVKELKTKEFTLTMDKDFSGVISKCAKVKRKGQLGTWILPGMVEAYMELHNLGVAHSVECWQGDNLVGGLYGVFVEGVFSGESMFFSKTGASKACLVYMVQHLVSCGYKWMDVQMVTPVLEMFGAEYVERAEYLKLLVESQNEETKWVAAQPKVKFQVGV